MIITEGVIDKERKRRIEDVVLRLDMVEDVAGELGELLLERTENPLVEDEMKAEWSRTAALL